MKKRPESDYDTFARALIPKYEALRFGDVHRTTLPYFLAPPADVLDIGAGSGRDAAALDRRGYTVTAVEPSGSFLNAAKELHPSSSINWLRDSLPELGCIPKNQRYNLILATAVWMHLEKHERQMAMSRVAELLTPGGRIIISVRHGPPPKERTMYSVPDQEMSALAQDNSLTMIFEKTGEASLQAENKMSGVTWSKFVFEKRGD